MLPKDFYPTPEPLIDRMLSGLDFEMIKSILEPSAGKGNIVEKIKEKEKIYSTPYNHFKFDIDCIEIEQNLQYILKGKNYRVVYNDFLTYNTMKEYDLIVMNPPFGNDILSDSPALIFCGFQTLFYKNFPLFCQKHLTNQSKNAALRAS